MSDGDVTDDLKLLVRTRHAIVTIRTLDEEFATRAIRLAGRDLHMAVLQWSLSDGLNRIEPPSNGNMGGTSALAGALKFMRGNNAFNLYVLKDALVHLEDRTCQRLLRETAMEFSRDERTIFLIDPDGTLPPALAAAAVPYELALPNEQEILQLVRKTVSDLNLYGKTDVRMSRADSEKFLNNLRGLTRTEISQVVAHAVLDDGRLDEADVNRAIELKRHRFQQTGVLDYVPPPQAKPQVGGMHNLLNWLRPRAGALSAEAREYGLQPPRGILMLGVQGCGKSLMARMVAAEWNLPLLRMDVGALYDKYVGETERHLRHAFAVCSAMSPCVLWIDEIEKAFASASAGAASDGGLSQRMFGQLLTWMQDHREAVFLIATANNIAALPPEMMRKGRFDEIFFVDLPADDARREIFAIHLARRNRDAGCYDTEALAAASEGFSGAEIEQAIVSAMYAAFQERREFATEDILAELKQTRPLSVVRAEQLAQLRAWAADRCVPAD